MTINIDADLRNADWLKTRTWDIWTKDWRPVTTPEELAKAIAPMSVEHFLTLPAAEAMPEELRAALAR